jgi:prevent-host-death family protein
MSEYSVAEAKNHLPRLIRDAEAGQDVRLTRRGKPVARLVGEERYEELTSGRRSFSEAYEDFRQKYDLAELGIDVDDLYGKLRDKDPGRDFSW